MSDELVDLAVTTARDAGQLLLDYAQRRHLDVETKTSATDPVSEADRAAERLITDRILTARPEDGIVGEEDQANRSGSSGRVWLVDPLDGTVNYLYGIPAWCVSICCRDEEGALIGVVHDPNRDEVFTAVRGVGAWSGSGPLHVSTAGALEEALVATGFSYGAERRGAQGRWAADLLTRARDLRRFGAAALDLAWTAAGRFDGFYEVGLHPWDYAAGMLIVDEAGGRTSRRDVELAGEPVECVLAGAPRIHDALVEWLVGEVS
jgi:myo-inositol-1(or 4)-monophosphatase